VLEAVPTTVPTDSAITPLCPCVTCPLLRAPLPSLGLPLGPRLPSPPRPAIAGPGQDSDPCRARTDHSSHVRDSPVNTHPSGKYSLSLGPIFGSSSAGNPRNCRPCEETVVYANELPVHSHPQPARAGCRAAASRVQRFLQARKLPIFSQATRRGGKPSSCRRSDHDGSV
jgi:hypothetical protein